jgi:hypothetical protein
MGNKTEEREVTQRSYLAIDELHADSIGQKQQDFILRISGLRGCYITLHAIDAFDFAYN